MVSRSPALLTLAAVLAWTSVRAAGPQGPQSPSPVFRAGVDYVTVDVVVTDDKNHPIRDLTAADFEITEHGQAQSISDFKYISIPVSHRTIDLKATSAPPADVATNALPSPNSRLFVLVVDDLHLIESAIVPVKRVMTDFVSKLSPDDEVGIVFVGHSDLSVNITRDTGLLTRAINNVRGAFGFGLETPRVAPGQLAGQNLGKPSAMSGAVVITGPSAIGARTFALAPGAAPDGRQTSTVDTRVPLAGLGAGDYVLDLVVRLAKGTPVHRSVPFRVR